MFSYTVVSGKTDADGIAIGADKLSVEEGNIQDVFGNAASLTHGPVAADHGHKVDAVGPTVSSIAITSDPGDDDTYGVGDSIEVTVTFNEDVTITGSAHSWR